MRLAAELDSARLYQAAAYISMAGDSIPCDVAQDRLRQAQDDRPGDGGRPDSTDIDLDFTLDEQDRVWMIREGDCHIIGRTDAVCAEMRRFLADVASGGDGYG